MTRAFKILCIVSALLYFSAFSCYSSDSATMPVVKTRLCASGRTTVKSGSSDSDKSFQSARELLKQGQIELCESNLAKLLSEEPTNLPARKMHADVLYQLARYHFAASEANQVLLSSPDDANVLLLMGKISQSIHKPTEAIKFYEKYLSTAPESSEANQYKLLISVLKDEEAAQQEKRSRNRKSAGDYFAAISGGALSKWKNADKIRVFIKDGNAVDGYRSEFEESLPLPKIIYTTFVCTR